MNSDLKSVPSHPLDALAEEIRPKKVLALIGTRPECVKMAPVVHALEQHPEFEVRVCLTAQHRDMLDQIVELFGLQADYDLDIMRAGQSLTEITTRVLQGLAPILDAEKPDWVLVQGDTTTAMAGSLSAFYHGVRVGHVEAGLRTWNKAHPFPEEVNRKVAGVLADLHFAPTHWAASNLAREGTSLDTVFVTGNTVIDALQHVADKPFDPAGSELEDVPAGDKPLVVVTAHRRENFGEGMRAIGEGVRNAARENPDAHFVCPVHLNPNVQILREYLQDEPNVTLVSPLDYRPMVWLLANCSLVVTDSGGLQEEAAGFGKPVLVLRETTERPEGVEAGTARLLGTHAGRLTYWISHLLGDQEAYARMSKAHSPYGQGDSASQIVDILGGSEAVRPFSHAFEDIAEDVAVETDVSRRAGGRARRRASTRRSDPPWARERVLAQRA
jgi:UDP-N-acetylglucosamine 2-epimerase (non-hydrolysing)